MKLPYIAQRLFLKGRTEKRGNANVGCLVGLQPAAFGFLCRLFQVRASDRDCAATLQCQRELFREKVWEKEQIAPLRRRA